MVEIGGHQLVVEEGRWYTVNRLEVSCTRRTSRTGLPLVLSCSDGNLPLPPAVQVEPGSRIQLGRVLALKQGGTFSVGQPYLEGVTVQAEVLEELKGPKVRQQGEGVGRGEWLPGCTALCCLEVLRWWVARKRGGCAAQCAKALIWIIPAVRRSLSTRCAPKSIIGSMPATASHSLRSWSPRLLDAFSYRRVTCSQHPCLTPPVVPGNCCQPVRKAPRNRFVHKGQANQLVGPHPARRTQGGEQGKFLISWSCR